MPKTKKEPAVIVTPGRHTLPSSIATAQFFFMAEMGPYLKQAGLRNQEDEFYEAMFKLWFSYWPEIPIDNDDVDFAAHRVKLTKKACKGDLFYLRVTKTNPSKSWEDFIAEKQEAFDTSLASPIKYIPAFSNLNHSKLQKANTSSKVKSSSKRVFEEAFMGQGDGDVVEMSGSLVKKEKLSLEMDASVAQAVSDHPVRQVIKPTIKPTCPSPEYILVDDFSDSELEAALATSDAKANKIPGPAPEFIFVEESQSGCDTLSFISDVPTNVLHI